MSSGCHNIKASSVICRNPSHSYNTLILFILLELVLVPLHSFHYTCFILNRYLCLVSSVNTILYTSLARWAHRHFTKCYNLKLDVVAITHRNSTCSLLTSAKLSTGYLVVEITREPNKELSLHCYPIYISYRWFMLQQCVCLMSTPQWLCKTVHPALMSMLL